MPAVPPTVLLVEDDADARAALARALGRAGFRCLPAAGVAEALAAIPGAGFLDAIVTDVVMDGDDRAGLRLLAALRDADVRAPVVVITAFADLDRVKEALNLGAAQLLEKPFRAPDLVGAIERAMAERGDVGWQVDRALAHAGLTPKEMAVARLVLKGLTSVEIARIEQNSDKTIRQHLTQIFAKCGVSSRAELFHFVFPS